MDNHLSFRPLPNLGECTEADAFEAWSAAHRDHQGFDAEAEECRSCRDAKAEVNSARFRELKSQLDRVGIGGGPLPDVLLAPDLREVHAVGGRSFVGFSRDSVWLGLESGAAICKRLGHPDDCTCWATTST